MVVTSVDCVGPSASQMTVRKTTTILLGGKEGPDKPMGFCFCGQMNKMRSFTLHLHS